MLSNSSLPVAGLKGEVLDKSAKKSPDGGRRVHEIYLISCS